ncbi:hypothetical protein ACFFX0_08005 [Citricoccus parietis]|uniref:Uncharacterized protein n=1 Tax=Citricoccus parietis TaxID=592307 RepID=A0ABV5FWY6_9MICC
MGTASNGSGAERHCAAGPRQRCAAASAMAARAAWSPAMPWTPPPGGVEEEARYRPGVEVRCGLRTGAGRRICCSPPMDPPATSPPMRLGFQDSRADGGVATRWTMRSRKPGAKRSICDSIRSSTGAS